MKKIIVLSLVLLCVMQTVFANTKSFAPSEIASIQQNTQAQLDSEEMQRFTQQMGKDYQSTSVKMAQSKKRRGALMVLVSFSMPVPMIKRYAMDAKKVGAVIVLRGFVKNNINSVARLVHEVLGADDLGLTIDPIVFEKLAIQRVPAFVLFNEHGVACLNDNDCIPDDNDYDFLSGNVTLAYALSQFANRDGALAKSATALLIKLREQGGA